MQYIGVEGFDEQVVEKIEGQLSARIQLMLQNMIRNVDKRLQRTKPKESLFIELVSKRKAYQRVLQNLRMKHLPNLKQEKVG